MEASRNRGAFKLNRRIYRVARDARKDIVAKTNLEKTYSINYSRTLK